MAAPYLPVRPTARPDAPGRVTRVQVRVRATEYTARPRGQARQDQAALLPERPALQALPRRVPAHGEAGPRRAPRAAGLQGLRVGLQEAAEGSSRALSGGRSARGRTLWAHGHLPRDRWRGLPGVAPVRRAPAPWTPRDLRGQPGNG